MQALSLRGAAFHNAWRRLTRRTTMLVVPLILAAPSLGAQTDYYNTDAGRPLRIEDALIIERHAFELQAAPLTLERSRGGRYAWTLEPEIAWGLFPRTQIEVAFPLRFQDHASRQTGGLAGIEASMAYSLNAETLTLPAMTLRGAVLAPVGHLAPSSAFASLGAMVTRTTSFGRLHLNGLYTVGSVKDDVSTPLPPPSADADPHLPERWLAGAAVDRAFAVRSVLVGAELFASKKVGAGSEISWTAGVGVRYQANPRFALDAGVGRSFDDDRAWALTFGSAYAFALPFFMPSGR